VVVGTHALLHHPELYKEVGLVVIDEQHRFGVRQRALISELSEKRRLTPHILTMTATPIPRTIALTLYGELSLSTLDELPKGRIPIKTWVVPENKRNDAYSWIEKEILTHKSQVFVVCPLIDESEVATMKEVKAAKAEYEKLTNIFPSLRVVLLHGKMKKTEKSKILSDYKEGLYDILVTTPVVEVGIDIPNASIMMIEASERFGLAQLHQLRGRVGRGTLASYCLLMTTTTGAAKSRLEAMTKTLSGRELAEFDLSLRGPGEIFGTKQSGITELKIANWQDTELISKASTTAQTVVDDQEKYSEVIAFFASQQIVDN
jgi:ATP-dependent DNA helicase RecG